MMNMIPIIGQFRNNPGLSDGVFMVIIVVHMYTNYVTHYANRSKRTSRKIYALTFYVLWITMYGTIKNYNLHNSHKYNSHIKISLYGI